ncbi:MAG TPA: CoA-binding protein, partial [Saprospiraceae bacterium]|nr:CoA-binding protein [Saprospiraceae bacterium]
MQSKRSSLQQLDRIFKPNSIAIIGGSVRPEAAGYTVMRNLIAGGFQGQLVAINPKYNDVQGKPCYRSIGRAPGPIDLAVITTPNRTIPELLKECGEAGVGGIVIISSGFKDIGDARHDIYANMMRIAHQYGMRIVGPNSIGIINPHLDMQAAYTR